jgi:hypothetical protein
MEFEKFTKPIKKRSIEYVEGMSTTIGQKTSLRIPL